jgi:hypothetical protein
MTMTIIDGEDTNYLANLNALGAVKVPQQPSFFKPVRVPSFLLTFSHHLTHTPYN